MEKDLLLVKERIADLWRLGGVQTLVGWDSAVMMPHAGSETRAGQSAVLARIAHDLLVEPRLGEALGRVDDAGLDEEDRAYLRLVRRMHRQAVAVPADLVAALAAEVSRGRVSWENARRTDDFAAFAPALERIVELTRQKADALGYAGERYDALLDLFEEGATVAGVEPTLRRVAKALGPVLDAVLGAGGGERALPPGPYDHDRQVAYNRDVAARIGFDFAGGRLDLSAHPFMTSPGHGDVRMTTRVDLLDPFNTVSGTIHEAGHAMYEQGFPARWAGTPLAESPSYAMHESQSRLWENHVGRSLAFWEGEYPRLQEQVGGLDDCSLDTAFRHLNRVRRSLIRVDADELTYPLHIVLRFELELALFRGDLQVRDLPGAWRDAMKRHLQIVPANDAEGVLQDVHWSGGMFGYFPTYLLGSIYAAALYRRAESDLGGREAVAASFRRGDFEPLLRWLRERVHSRGSMLNAQALVAEATGGPEGVDTEPYVEHLSERYLSLYGAHV
ncbi:MAG: carboxypeptidase M32 [Candidatus Dormibacteria bacterium]